MKKKLLSHILMVATILTSYTVGTMQPTQTVNASTPKQISVTNAIPICDIAGYFYDKYGYLCFELGDTTKQFNKTDGYSYSKICEKLPHLKDLDENKTYSLTAKVTKVNKKKNVVTVQDYSGNKWKFRGCEDYKNGDVVSMLMDSNGTKKITKVLQLIKSGELPLVKVGKDYITTFNLLEEWIKNHIGEEIYY